MDVSNRKLLIIALILGVFASGFTYWYISKIEAEKKQMDPTEMLIIAKIDIPPKTEITRDMIQLKEIKKDSLPPSYFTEEQKVIGQIAKETVYMGEAVVPERLADEAFRSQHLSYTIPKGYRAIALQYNPVMGVGGFITPGDYVDVIGTYEPDYNSTNSDLSKTILQNILVLAVDRNSDPQSVSSDQQPISTITLAVKPEQAEKLTFTEERANIRLLLRPLNENNITSTKGITKNNVITTMEE